MDADSWTDRGAGKSPHSPGYVYKPKVPLSPQTLEELLEQVGPYAVAAKAYLEWHAVTLWKMKEGYEILSAIPELAGSVSTLSICLVREAAEQGAGWPNSEGSIITPAIYGYSIDCQYEARRTANEVRALWEAAGRPYLRPSDYKFVLQYLTLCIGNGVIPQQATIGDVPPHDTQ